MASRSVMAQGDYLMISQNAAWKMSAQQKPYLNLFARVVAYYRVRNGIEGAYYESTRTGRHVKIFMEDEGREALTLVRLRAVGWRGDDVATINEDVSRGVLFRAHCKHKPSHKQGEIYENWHVVAWEKRWHDEPSDPHAERLAQELVNPALAELAALV